MPFVIVFDFLVPFCIDTCGPDAVDIKGRSGVDPWPGGREP